MHIAEIFEYVKCLQFLFLFKLEDAARDLGTCEKLIRTLGVTTNGGSNMNIDGSSGLTGESPGCTWHPGDDDKGYHQLLTLGNEKPTCDGQIGTNTPRRRVCACQPCPKKYCTSEQLAINYEGADYGICTNQETDTGNWNVYYSAEELMQYSDAKEKCSSLGATLVGEDALDTVRS